MPESAQEGSRERERPSRFTRFLLGLFLASFALMLLFSACAVHDLVRSARSARQDQQADGLAFQRVGDWFRARLPASEPRLLGLPSPTYLGPALAFMAAWPASAVAVLILAIALRRRMPRWRRLLAGASALAAVLLVLNAICACTVWRQQLGGSGDGPEARAGLERRAPLSESAS
jgi:hypothetical protein